MEVKIKAKNPNVKGMKLTVPYDGTIDIDAYGNTTVSEKAAKALVDGTNDWEYFDKRNGKTKEGEDSSEDKDDEKSDTEKVVSGIKKMKLDEMITMASEAGYPKEEWERFSKKDKLMAAYLIKKYNEVELDGASEE